MQRKGHLRPSRLCVLMNPILPGAIHQDLAGEILKQLFSRGPNPFGRRKS
jgi:hypothetical protein